MRSGKWLSVPVAFATLAACGIVAKVDARNDMERSKAVYKACLAANPTNIPACDAAKLAYDADMRAYRAESAGIQPGTNNTINIPSPD